MTNVSRDVLRLDCEKETERILDSFKDVIVQRFRRRGGVVALSGGVDSSVTAALCVRAFGKERVFGLLMPDRDSSPDTLKLSRLAAESLGIEYCVTDITPILEAEGCYAIRDEAIRSVVPEYQPSFANKIVLAGGHGTPYRVFRIVVRLPDGKEIRARLPSQQYRTIVAAMNFKQRTRKMLEYFHADRLHYAVIGTSNRLEVDQGFFVKLGDGAGDFKPIAHLFKSQVYQLAEYLHVPYEIRQKPPTPDTYSLPQTQQEFYFLAPYDVMDISIWARDQGFPAEQVAVALGERLDLISDVYSDIVAKRQVADYLSCPPVGVKSHQ